MLSLSYIGIRKLYLLVAKKENLLDILLITLFYCFNTLVVIFLSTGNFWDISFIISYSVLPLTVFLTYRFFDKGTFNKVELIVLLGVLVAAFLYIQFIIPIALILVTIVLINFGAKIFSVISLKDIIFSVCLFLLIFSPSIYAYYLNNIGSFGNPVDLVLKESMAGAIQGGIFSMMVNHFSWAIYNLWKPRSILPFYNYFESVSYLIVSLSVYFVFLIYAIKKTKSGKFFNSIFLILLMSLFFAKGPQKPFGFIYQFLVNDVPLFQIVRTPDNKFAIGVMFSMAVLYIYILSSSSKSLKHFIRLHLLIVIMVWSYPILTKDAIIGKNNPGISGDFITRIYPEHSEVTERLNSERNYYGILLYPPTSLPETVEKNGNIFIGRDNIGGAGTKLPVYYLTYDLHSDPEFSVILKNIYKEMNLEEISSISAKYIIIRKDIYPGESLDKSIEFKDKIDKTPGFKMLVNNDLLYLYEIPEYLVTEPFSIDCKKDGNISYEFVSPVMYKLSISDAEYPCKLKFMGMPNNSWTFLNNIGDQKIDISDFYKPINIRKVSNGYPNEWVIEEKDAQSYLNKDKGNENNLNIFMYYMPQMYMNLLVVVSGMVLFGCVVYVLKNRKHCNIFNS